MQFRILLALVCLSPSLALADSSIDKFEKLMASLKNIEVILENALPFPEDKKEHMSEDASRLASAFSRDDCESNLPERIDSVDVDADLDFNIPIFELEVGGAKCPISMKAGGRGEQVGSAGRGQIYVDYVARDPEFQEYGGLIELHLVFDIHIEVEGLEGESSNKSVKGGFTVSGNGMSLLVGPFRQEISMNFDVAISIPDGLFDALLNFGIKFIGREKSLIEFDDSKFELKRDTDMKSLFGLPKVVTTLNGEKISNSDYERLSKQIAVPGMGELDEVMNPGDSAGSKMRCDLVMQYPDPMVPAAVVNNCSGDRHVVVFKNTGYVANFVHQEDLTEVKISRKDQSILPFSFYLLPDENFYRSIEYDGLSVQLRCQEDVLCSN